MRVAERLSYQFPVADHTLFFGGSVAPDTGVEPDISHWCTNGDKSACRTAAFFDEYVRASAGSEREFYLGYYIHLSTDVLWQTGPLAPLKLLPVAEVRAMKRHWSEVDRHFLWRNPNYGPLVSLRDTEKLRQRWFNYYPEDTVPELVEAFQRSGRERHATIADPQAELSIVRFIDESALTIARDYLGKGERS